MKTISIDGTTTDKPDPRDAMFRPRKTFARAMNVQADGVHCYVQTPDGRTEHAVILASEMWAHVERACPQFCRPPRPAKPTPK